MKNEREDYRNHIIQQLIKRRNHLGVSQRCLNTRLGVADELVAKWEAGLRKPSPFLLQCWIEALGCELVVVNKD